MKVLRMGNDRLVKRVVMEAMEMARKDWMAKRLRARIGGVWLERC